MIVFCFWFMSRIECAAQSRETLSRFLPKDLIEHLVLTYLFAQCEKCKINYVSDKTLERLRVARVDYKQCNQCLEKCWLRECYWKGRSEEFIYQHLCPNHYAMLIDGDPDYPFCCARCREKVPLPTMKPGYLCNPCAEYLTCSCSDCGVVCSHYVKESLCWSCHCKKQIRDVPPPSLSLEVPLSAAVGAALGVVGGLVAYRAVLNCKRKNKRKERDDK